MFHSFSVPHDTYKKARFASETNFCYNIICIFCGFYNIKYAVWIGLLLISTMFFTLLQDIIRGLGKNKEYAFYGILNSLIMLFAEIIGLVVLKLGVEALIISKVLAYIVCIIFMIAKNY